MLPTEAFRSPDRSNWSSEVLVSDEGVGGGGDKKTWDAGISTRAPLVRRECSHHCFNVVKQQCLIFSNLEMPQNRGGSQECKALGRFGPSAPSSLSTTNIL